MNFDNAMADRVAALYFEILARRAKIQAEIAELVRQTQEIALHLEALQQHRRSSYLDNVAKAFRISHAAAMNEQRNLRRAAKTPVDKSFFVFNGILPAPAKKTPKKAKPSSPIGKIGSLQAEVIRAKERGLNPQEDAIIKAIIDQLRRSFDA